MRPSASRRDVASARSRALTGADRAPLAAKSKRSSTLLATLLTFCPPGPDDRAAVHASSASGITTAGETTRSATARRSLRGAGRLGARSGARRAARLRRAPGAGGLRGGRRLGLAVRRGFLGRGHRRIERPEADGHFWLGAVDDHPAHHVALVAHLERHPFARLDLQRDR